MDARTSVGACLPRVDDIPVILQDRDSTEDGQLDFTIDEGANGNLDGTGGNGTIDPFVEVPRGLVRLRLLMAARPASTAPALRGPR